MRVHDEPREAFIARFREANKHNPDPNIQELMADDSILDDIREALIQKERGIPGVTRQQFLEEEESRGQRGSEGV